MPRAAFVLLTAWAGCGGPDPDGDSGGPLPELSVRCVEQPGNALRSECAVTGAVGALTVELQEAGRPARTLDLPAGTTAFTLTGLAPDTTYAFAARTARQHAEGQLVIGPVPDAVPKMVEVEGAPSVPYILLGVDQWLIIVDDLGRVVWYQALEPEGSYPQGGRVSGYDFTGDGVVWSITSKLTHMALDGTVRFATRYPDDFDRPLHHDVSWFGGRFWSLNAAIHDVGGTDFIFDGLYAFDAQGQVVAEWDWYDHRTWDPVKTGVASALWGDFFGPGTEEAGHANAVFEAADGTLLFSLRATSEVVFLDGVDSPSFGEVRATVRGTGGGTWAVQSAPGVTDDANFVGQHHPRLVGDRLTLYDNRLGPEARTVAMILDDDAGTATIVEAHRLDRACGIQGSNFELPNGNTLTSCSPTFEVFEFAAGSSEDAPPVFRMRGEERFFELARAIPIAEPPPGW